MDAEKLLQYTRRLIEGSSQTSIVNGADFGGFPDGDPVLHTLRLPIDGDQTSLELAVPDQIYQNEFDWQAELTLRQETAVIDHVLVLRDGTAVRAIARELTPLGPEEVTSFCRLVGGLKA